MKRKIILRLLFALACGLLLTSVALAAPEAANIDWYVIGGGGGHAETASGAITLDGTIGQPVAGIASANLCSGFWCSFNWLTTLKIFLPLILH
jgi:hypothetical protein